MQAIISAKALAALIQTTPNDEVSAPGSKSGGSVPVGSVPLHILDVRHDLDDHGLGRRQYQAGHIPGAQYVDVETELSGPQTGSNGRHPLPAPEVFVAGLIARGIQADHRIVVYDAKDSMFAARLWWMLRWVGATQVQVLDGGYEAWLASGGAAEQGETQADTATSETVLEATVRPTILTIQEGSAEHSASRSDIEARWGAAIPIGQGMGVVDVEAVERNLNESTEARFTVIDARARARFLGEDGARDKVAGHIPGALNRPFMDNLQVDGTFKSPQTLRAEWDAVLAELKPQQVVMQCGSGVSACHNLLAMNLAGLDGARLYPGSWSEWCSSAHRPVATGA